MLIAILGGGFNPPTIAYEKIVRLVLGKASVDQVWLMPYRQRAFGKIVLVDPAHRLAMASQMAKHIGERVQVSSFEVDRPGPTYTINTQRALMEAYPDHEFVWIIGSDILSELADWRAIDELQALTQFLCALRPGYPIDQKTVSRYAVQLLVGPGQMPDVSATEVRRRLTLRKPITDLVPPYIARYVEQHGLYREDAPI